MAKKAAKTAKIQKKKHVHRFSTYLKEIRPTWKKHPEKVIPMIKDMVEKKADFLLEGQYYMEFIERFMLIHQDRIMKVRPVLFEEVLGWVIQRKLQYMIDIATWARRQIYESKYWINDEVHLAYLEREIEDLQVRMQVKHKAGRDEPERTEIYEMLKAGDFPDLSEYSIYDLAIVFADFEFIEYLKQERRRLLEAKTAKTVRVPVELKTKDSTHENELFVQIPPDFFRAIQKDVIQKELAAIDLPKNNPMPEPKLYTRKKTAEIMGVSVGTVDNLTKDGLLKPYRIGNTNLKRYTWEGIKAALQKIEMRYSERVGK